MSDEERRETANPPQSPEPTTLPPGGPLAEPDPDLSNPVPFEKWKEPLPDFVGGDQNGSDGDVQLR